MKHFSRLIMIFLSVIMLSYYAAGQQEEKQDEKKKFLTTWKAVGKLASQKRSFKTEKAVTVAGVRGAEAEDEALKHLYWRGSGTYPSRLELLNAIKILEASIEEDPEAETVPESRYFIAQCYLQLGNVEKAKENFNEIINSFPESEFIEDARNEIKKLNQNK